MNHQRTHGFSFVEVMFAVVVLGIGCVMAAAIFPVAIQQTQNNADEAVAAGLARDATHLIATNTTLGEYTTDIEGTTQPFTTGTGNLWAAVSSSAVDPTDTRYAWVPFARKGSVAGTYIVTFLIVRRAIHDHYTNTGELTPRGIAFQNLTNSADGTSTIDVTKDPSGNFLAMAPGTFLIVGDGRIWRTLAEQSETTETVTWSLQPDGSAVTDDGPTSGNASIIGRDWVNASDSSAGYGGPSQDVAVYTTMFCPQ